MDKVIMIVSAALLYALLVSLWKGRVKLKMIGEYRGVIGLTYSAILGIIGASIFMLQEKLLVGFNLPANFSFVFSVVIMLAVCIPLYLLFAKNRKLEQKN